MTELKPAVARSRFRQICSWDAADARGAYEDLADLGQTGALYYIDMDQAIREVERNPFLLESNAHWFDDQGHVDDLRLLRKQGWTDTGEER